MNQIQRVISQNEPKLTENKLILMHFQRKNQHFQPKKLHSGGFHLKKRTHQNKI